MSNPHPAYSDAHLDVINALGVADVSVAVSLFAMCPHALPSHAFAPLGAEPRQGSEAHGIVAITPPVSTAESMAARLHTELCLRMNWGSPRPEQRAAISDPC